MTSYLSACVFLHACVLVCESARVHPRTRVRSELKRLPPEEKKKTVMPDSRGKTKQRQIHLKQV